MTDELLYRLENRVAWLTLNREAKRNALTPEMLTGFHEYLDRIEKDPDVRVVCVTGTGEKAFCSGADLGGGSMDTENESDSIPRRYANLMSKLANFSKPIVARVAGPSLAGGVGLMTACHIVIARNDVFFKLPEINVGLFPFMVGALLFRNVLWKKALEMALTGRKVSPAEAEAMGLITFAVLPDEFEERVNSTLEKLADSSPIALRMGLDAFRKVPDMPMDDALPYLSGLLAKAAATDDAKEGISAFIEKRKPNFTGK